MTMLMPLSSDVVATAPTAACISDPRAERLLIKLCVVFAHG